MTKYTKEDHDAAYYVNLDSGTRFDHRDRIAQLIADTREAATKAERERTSDRLREIYDDANCVCGDLKLYILELESGE